ECHDRPNDLDALVLRRHIVYERLVDLNPVEGESPQVAQRRISGSEVVDSEPDPKTPQSFKGFIVLLSRFQQDGFGQLKLECARSNAKFGEALRDDPIEAGRQLELCGGDVHRHKGGCDPLISPESDLPTGLLDHPLPDW